MKIKSNSNFLALILSTIFVVGLFVTMGVLIFQDAGLKKESSKMLNVQFLRNFKERDVENLTRQKPEKPKEPVKAPDVTQVSVTKPNKDQILKMQNFVQTFDASASGSGIAAGGFGMGEQDDNATLIPLVSIQPELPTKARIEGITGSVTAVFDVNTQGFVENVRIIKSNPSQLFDQSVIRALYASRYKPKKIDGKPVAVRGNMKIYNLGF